MGDLQGATGQLWKPFDSDFLTLRAKESAQKRVRIKKLCLGFLKGSKIEIVGQRNNGELCRALQYGWIANVGTWSNMVGVPIVVEHCCPTALVSTEYIILINYISSLLHLNDLQKCVPSSGHVTPCSGPDFYEAW